MKRFFYIVLLGTLFSINAFAQQNRPGHDWTVNSSQYSNNMNMIIQVQQNGIIDASLMIGAFCGDECRGTANATHYNTLGDFWFLTIHGINDGDPISFYVKKDGVELDMVTTYSTVFITNDMLGDILHPVVINFISLSARDYTLITDPSQLVVGRSLFIANGMQGTVSAMGSQDNGLRNPVEIELTDHRVNLTPAYNALDESDVFVFSLGGDATGWTLFDEVNIGYLRSTGTRFDLSVDATLNELSKWQITLNANGTVTLYNDNANYYIAFYEGEGFYCSKEPMDLYLFTECSVVSGMQNVIAIDDVTTMYVVPSGSVLTVNELSTVDASNLIIEDGAQLVSSSPNVLATLQKNIIAYSDAQTNEGWYTIAAPLAAAAVSSSSNLTVNDFDLYEFDETNLTNEEWRNYKTPGNFVEFTQGRGYLYANNTDMTVNLFGVLNSSDVSVPVTYTEARSDELKGFNLIGNPFPHVIYKGQGGAIDDSRLADGYYLLSNDGSWQVKTCTDPILPGMGIMVLTSEAGNLTIAKTTAQAAAESGAKRGSKMDLGRLSLCVGNGASTDVAYLYGGTNGRNLTKISHQNSQVPELSFCSNRERYAICHLEEDEDAVDVRFDHQATASYTMTWDVADWHGSHPY